MKRTIISLGVLAVAAVAVVLVVVFVPRRTSQPVVSQTAYEKLSAYPVFSMSLKEAGYDLDRIGYQSFSPDGKYLAWSAFKDAGNPSNRGYVMDLATGVVVPLAGTLQRGFKDGRYLSVYGPNEGLFLFDPASSEKIDVPAMEETYDAFVSPDEKRAVLNGGNVSVVDLKTGAERTLDHADNSAGYAWFPDSVRILGFRENDTNLFEAGKGRDLGIWNADTGAFEPLEGEGIPQNPRYVEWLVQGRVARVNTGYDDGSHDYLVNVETKEVFDLGDTSAALMGGIVADQKVGVLAVVGGGGPDCQYDACRGFVARPDGSKTPFNLPSRFYRTNLQVVSDTKLAYIRRSVVEDSGPYSGTAELVMYDLKSGTETVIRKLPSGIYLSLAVSASKDLWLVSAEDSFILGKF